MEHCRLHQRYQQAMLHTPVLRKIVQTVSVFFFQKQKSKIFGSGGTCHQNIVWKSLAALNKCIVSLITKHQRLNTNTYTHSLLLQIINNNNYGRRETNGMRLFPSYVFDPSSYSCNRSIFMNHCILFNKILSAIRDEKWQIIVNLILVFNTEFIMLSF